MTPRLWSLAKYSDSPRLWRTHSCVPRRHSCRRLAAAHSKGRDESRSGTLKRAPRLCDR